ncbi:MAG: dihydroorotase [Bacteroidota bacterium]
MNLLLRGGHVVDPLTERDEAADILIRDGVIALVGPHLDAPRGTDVRELWGAVVFPGFMDMHVHLREPGAEHKETIASGCAAAAAGGFTAVCSMPNTDPAADDASVVRFIQERARLCMGGLVDVHPVGAVTMGRKGEHLAPLAELSRAGAVAFSDDGDPVHDGEILRRALEYAAMEDRPVIQHAQDRSMTRGGLMHEGFQATRLGLAGMPSIAETIMVGRDLAIAGFTGGRYHVAHISSAGSVELVRQGKNRGVAVTAEVTPHHLTLTDEAVSSYDTNTKMNPPLRPREDVEALREGLRDGTIDVIASDHAPHSFDEKQVEFQAAPFGIVGLETSLGLCLTELVHGGILTLVQLAEKCSVNPRKILRLPPVRVAQGERACLTLVDPSLEWTVDPAGFRSRSRNTPFGGRRLKGRALGIVNNGGVFWA